MEFYFILFLVKISSKADVVGLQEVRWDSESTDASPFQLDHLARRLGSEWQYVWIAAMSYWGDDRYPGVEDEGMAVFSRYVGLKFFFIWNVL